MIFLRDIFNKHSFQKIICVAALGLGALGIASGFYSVASGDVASGIIAGVLCGGGIAFAGYKGLRNLSRQNRIA